MRSTADRLTPAGAREFERFFLDTRGRTFAFVLPLVAHSADAEDITQEAYERALAHWDRIRQYEQPAAWVRRVAYNLALNRIRSSRWAVLTHLTEVFDRAAPDVDPDEPEIVVALRTLPRRYRVVLTMRYVLQFTTREIAEELGMDLNTVGSQIQRGKRHLERALAAQVSTSQTRESHDAL